MEVQGINNHALIIIILGSGGAFLLSASVVLFFFRYQKKTQRQKEELLRAELAFRQELVHANIRSQEEERVRISRDLHDHVGSSLASLRILIDQLEDINTTAARERNLAGNYKEMIDGVINDVRNISHSLAPPGLALWGLQESLDALCEKTSKVTGIPILVTCDSKDNLQSFSFDHSLGIYRVVQELIANTLKHAAATEITIAIHEKPDNLSITYKDNGKGCDTNPTSRKGIGVRNMESRLAMIDATHTIDSAPGKGYIFIMNIPRTPH